MTSPPPTERLEVGSIGKAHGLRGEVFVRLTTDRSERVDPASVLYAGDEILVVRSSRPHQNGWLVAFEDVTDRNRAEELRGAVLFADPIDDPDALWVHDLIGAIIREVDGTDRGVVESVQANPASDLLVTNEGALVPLTFVLELTDGVVIVDTPAGLFDLDGE